MYIVGLSQGDRRNLNLKMKKLNTRRKETESFVETHDSKGILQILRKEQILLIRGGPGSGKTVTAFFTAFQLEKEDKYQIIPSKNPKDIMTFAAADGQTIFIYDDTFGKATVNTEIYNKWKKRDTIDDVNSMLKDNPKLKLIFICRSQIKTDRFFREFGNRAFCYLLNLNMNEKMMIAKKYYRNCPNDLLDENLYANLPFFPLLCKKHSTKDGKNDNLKTCANEIISEELTLLQHEGPLPFLALAFLIVFNNTIKKGLFTNMTNELEVTENVLSSLMHEHINNPKPSHGEILSTFYDLKGTYLIENEDSFKAINNTMYDFIVCYVGRHFCRTILKFADDSFFIDRIHIESLKSADKFKSISLPCSLESNYFDRFVRILKHGNIRKVFSNVQTNDTEYRSKFIKHCIESDIDLDNFTDSADGCTILHVCANSGYVDIAKFILKNNNDLANKTDKTGTVPLHVACAYGFFDVANMLLEYTSKINIIDDNALTPLHICCMHGHTKLAEVLIKNGADINLCSPEHGTPIFLAVRNQSLEVIDLLLNNDADANKGTEAGLTPLHDACANNQKETVNILVNQNKAEIDINKVDKDGCTPLNITCQKGYKDLAETLICNKNEKAAINKAAFNGLAPIHIAVSRNHFRLTELLLRQNAAVDKRSHKGFTSLYFACQNGNLDMVKLLLNYRVDINCQNEILNRTPLHAAYKNNHHNIVNYLLKQVNAMKASSYKYMLLFTACLFGDVNAVKYLLHNSLLFIDINYKRKGETVLCIASKKMYPKLVELLLQHNPDINFHSNTGWTALCLACKNGDKETVELLIKHKASVHIATKSRLTPLFISCLYSHYHLIETLIRHGAYVDEGDLHGWTPLQISCYNGQTEIIETLFKNKAKVNFEEEVCWKEERKIHKKMKLSHNVNHMLIERKRNVQNDFRIKQTPLCISCAQFDEHAVNDLIDAGAEINQGCVSDDFIYTLHACDSYVESRFESGHISSKETFNEKANLTPLQIACYKKNTDVIKLLLKHKAAVNIFSPKGIITNDTISYTQYIDMMRQNAETSPQVSPLNIAIKTGQISIVKTLLENGANINKPTITGCTPLHLAIENDQTNSLELIKLLLDSKDGCVVNHYMPGVGTPLYLACSRNKLTIVELLIRRNANVNQVGDGGQTALQVACSRGNTEIVHELLGYSAELNSEGQRGPNPLKIATTQSFSDINYLLMEYNPTIRTTTCFKMMYPFKNK